MGNIFSFHKGAPGPYSLSLYQKEQLRHFLKNVLEPHMTELAFLGELTLLISYFVHYLSVTSLNCRYLLAHTLPPFVFICC